VLRYILIFEKGLLGVRNAGEAFHVASKGCPKAIEENYDRILLPLKDKTR